MFASLTLVTATGTIAAGVVNEPTGRPAALSPEAPDHLVVSEVMTGGASASDEFIEIYNPTPFAAALTDLELVYVTASGGTVARKAHWESGSVPPYAHVLVANEAGIFATIADERFSGGLSATGGTVALRPTGDDVAVDAVGWGSADNGWTEGRAVAAPTSRSSVERLPGGDAGSGVDSDDNATDFVERTNPEPQNSGSPPTAPPDAPTPGPTLASPTEVPPRPSTPASPTPRTSSPRPTSSLAPPSASPSVTPAPAAVSVAAARAAPPGTRVTVRGVALTSSSFNDGGGYLADDTAGIAVLVSGGSFERGERVQVSGEVGERYHQWTLRVDAADVSRLGSSPDPASVGVATGEVREDDESELIELAGRVVGSPTELAAGMAYDVDDGSGAVRVLVLDGTGIDTAEWQRGAEIEVRGVVGQRDSSGSGTAGYRVQPRAASDVLRVQAPPEATETASPPTSGASPSPSSTPSGPLVTIAAARSAEPGDTIRVRGVVTAGTGQVVDDGSAVIQDGSGAILLRLGDELGALTRGVVVEVSGERATKAGMATLRAGQLSELGQQSEPSPARLATGSLGEAHEAQLVIVRGAVASSVRESSAGSISFDVDDGSGPVRVFAFPSTGINATSIERGSWVEVTGILGQETSGDRPGEGYRLWPRGEGDVRVVAPAVPTDEADDSADGSDAADADARPATGGDGALAGTQDLAQAVGAAGVRADARATLVVGAWPELGLAGVLWDGKLVVGISEAGDATTRIADAVPVPPAVVELRGAARPGTVGPMPAALFDIDPETAVRAVVDAAIPPATDLPTREALVWGRVAGTVTSVDSTVSLVTPDATVTLDYACDEPSDAAIWPLPEGAAVIADGLVFLGDDSQPRVVAPCAGLQMAPTLEIAPTRTTAQPGDRGDVAEQAADASGTRTPPILIAGLGMPLLGVLGAMGWRFGTFARLAAAYRSAMARRDDDAPAGGGALSEMS